VLLLMLPAVKLAQLPLRHPQINKVCVTGYTLRSTRCVKLAQLPLRHPQTNKVCEDA